ncbi:uncharacterized protein N7446_007204 [Penicillium canescens]|uniref:DUF7702 domain-containing protein n=1 Tax=Penicillium canescens TaxID=5083 RepID=A0AAD6ILY5_PENCN|nr:uncharacterized protein N7446_007204 [Penicillium canescens]KAJ6049465.1 hypothetical protein N7444_006181 [Penicillium canescens]KAJ6052564.1 hypothetical protein N7460_003098 [Penicillium canescens]KAJ6063084.1 hypothetical protein N7446_007204 [Penicillium canescens]
MTNALSVAELAIYIALAFPTVYLIIKHGRQGLLGWLFLLIFCTLRIIGGALAINSSSPTANIISSVGLSPLLLATSGILHEARIYRIACLDQKIEWALSLFYHIFVVGGVALTAAGSAKLQKHQQPIEKAENIVKAGIVILAICWAALVPGTVFSFITPARKRAGGRAGTVLLATIAFALVFIGIRVLYSLVYLCTQKQYLSPTTGSLAIRVILGFLAELIAVVSLAVGGFMTQGASRESHEERELPIAHKSTSPVSLSRN